MQEQYFWEDIAHAVQINDPAFMENPFFYSVSPREGLSILEVSKMIKNWGLAPLGYLSPETDKVSISLFQTKTSPILPLISSRWFPTFIESPYFISVWKPGLYPNSPAARITVARNLGVEQMGKDLFFSTETGETAHSSSLFKCPGIPLWTEYAETSDAFREIIQKADDLIKEEETLNILYTLFKH